MKPTELPARPGRLRVALALLALTVAAPLAAQTDGSLRTRYRVLGPVVASVSQGPDGTLYWATEQPSFITPGYVYALSPTGALRTHYAVLEDIDSTPAVGPDGTVYFGTWDGRLIAVAPNGSLRWQVTGLTYIYGSPAVGPDGTVYVGAGDGNLHAVGANGQVLWSFPTGDWVDSSPALLADGTIVFGSWDNNLYALRPDGTLRWQVATGDSIVASPAVGADGTIYVGSRDGRMYAVQSDGTVRWSYPTPEGIEGGAALAPDGTIYFGSGDGFLFALNPDGTERWRYAAGVNPILSTPAVRADGSIVFGAGDNAIHCVTAAGLRRWRYLTGDYVDASPLVTADGRILVGSLDGWVYVLNSVSPPAESAWPAFRRDARRVGRQGPRLTQSPADVAVEPGGAVTLTAAATDGIGPIGWQWQRNGTDLPGATANTYTVAAAELATAGSYRAVARDASGAAVSAPARVTVAGADAVLANLSTRAAVGGGADVLIAGWVVTGTGSQALLVRAVGPTLGQFGLAGALADPRLVVQQGSLVLAENDQWEAGGGGAPIAAAGALVGAFPLEAGSRDAAVLTTLTPGAVTATVSGAEGGAGVALVEVYAAPGGTGATRLANLSSRARIGTGEAVLIAGLVVAGTTDRPVLIRGVGPALTAFGVEGALADPVITVRLGSAVVASNDDWYRGAGSADVWAAARAVGAFPLPEGGRDAALLLNLAPGAYTVELAGVGGTSGVALAEVYEIDRW